MTAEHSIMPLTTRSPRELSPSTTPSTLAGSSESAAKSARPNVIWLTLQLETQEPLALPDFEDIADVVKRLEKDLTRSESLANARKELARSQIAAERLSPIARLRLEKGWSQAKLADAMDTSQSHVARLESKNSDPQFSTLRKIATALGEPVGRLAEQLASEE